MFSSLIPRRILLGAVMVSAFAWVGSVKAGDLNPAAISIKLPKDIPWVENAKSGSANAVLVGDPAKPGFYAVMTKWHGGHMSRPHFHPNDRYITVLSGTWWVGTGTKYSPDTTTPIPAGSFVTHVGKQIHYDGSKEGDTVLLIMGEGPATSTPAEVK